MEHLVLITFTLSFFIFIQYLLGLYAKTKLPPGPIGLPLFGNLLQIGPKPHKSLAKLAKEYGPLITLQLGCYTSLVVSSPEMAREILQKHDADFSGRSIPDAVARGLPNHYVSVTWTSAGDQWRAIRRALTIYFTNPKKIDELEGLRLKVVTQMVDHIKELSKRGQVVDIGKVTFTTALNQMSNTCFSVDVADFDSDQDHVNGFYKAVKTIMKVVGKINFADYFPWLKIFDPQGIRRDAKAAYDSLGQLCQMFIAQRLRHRESKFPPHGDLLDSFLDCQEENPVDFDIVHIKVLLMDLFIAGTDNISGIVEWAMSELILHPNVLQKLREEISGKIGGKGSLKEAELLELPYLQSVLKETMRLHLSVPLLLPHKSEINVPLNGYMIPKNTRVIVNAWAIACSRCKFLGKS